MLSERELKKLKVDIFDTFKLNDASLKEQELKDFELDLIFKKFYKYNKNDVLKSIKMKISNLERKIFLREIKLDEIKNKVFKNIKILNGDNIYKLEDNLNIPKNEIKKLLKVCNVWFIENKIEVDLKSIEEAFKKEDFQDYDFRWEKNSRRKIQKITRRNQRKKMVKG